MARMMKLILSEVVPMLTLTAMLTTANVMYYLLRRFTTKAGRKIGKGIESLVVRLIKRR